MMLLLSWKIFPQVKHWLSDMMTGVNIKKNKKQKLTDLKIKHVALYNQKCIHYWSN